MMKQLIDKLERDHRLTKKEYTALISKFPSTLASASLLLLSSSA